MNPKDDKDRTQPAIDGKPDPVKKTPPQDIAENLEKQPDQPGAEYGGYGQADHAFGRDAGSSSNEGGQGGSGESGAGAQTAPKTRRGGSDGASQTRHSSDNDSQTQSADTKQQRSETPDQNRQDQGGQGNR